MTKNPFEDPKEKLWDVKIKDYKIPKRKKSPPKKETKHTKVPHIEDYIYVPSIKLYVAKERSLLRKFDNWYDAHKELHKKGMQMLTPRQFIDFILYLQKKPYIPDAKKVLDEILTVRFPFRAEWLDAKFAGENEIWYAHYNHRIVKGKLVAQDTEPLEKCLTEDRHIDLKSCNKQGLPTKEGKDIMYAPPIKGRVVGFSVSSLGAHLSCDMHTGYASPSMGVRAAFKKKTK